MELMILWWERHMELSFPNVGREAEKLLWRVAWAPAARSGRPKGVGGHRHSLPIGNGSVTGSAVSLSSPCSRNDTRNTGLGLGTGKSGRDNRNYGRKGRREHRMRKREKENKTKMTSI